MAKAKLVTRSATTSTVTDDNLNKASALTHAEMDSNLINLRDSSFGIADDTSTVLQVTNDKTITVAGAGTVGTALSGDTLTITGSGITATSTDTLQNKTIDTANNTITITESDISDLGSYITATSSDTLTNKTFDANGTGNSISNIETADIAAGTLVTAAEGIGSNDNDTTIPTSAAVKAYADSVGGGGGGTITALNNQAENRLVSIGSTTTELDGEANLTFDGSTLTLTGSAALDGVTITDNLITTNRSNDNLNIETNGTGQIQIRANGGDFANFSTAGRYESANNLYYEDLSTTLNASDRKYQNNIINNIKFTTGQNSSSSNDTFRNLAETRIDLNGSSATATSATYRARGPMGLDVRSTIDNSSSTNSTLGQASGGNYGIVISPTGTGNITITNTTGMGSYLDVPHNANMDITITDHVAYESVGIDHYGSGTGNFNITDFYSFRAGAHNDGATATLSLTNNYGFYFENDSTATNTYAFYDASNSLSVFGDIQTQGVSITDNLITTNRSNDSLFIGTNGTGRIELSTDGGQFASSTTYPKYFGNANRVLGVVLSRETSTDIDALTGREYGHVIHYGSTVTNGSTTNSNWNPRTCMFTNHTNMDGNSYTWASVFRGPTGLISAATANNGSGSSSSSLYTLRGAVMNAGISDYDSPSQDLTITNVKAVEAGCGVETNGSSTNTITDGYNFYSKGAVDSSGTSTNTITNLYGFYHDSTAGTNNYAFYDNANALSRFGAVILANQASDPSTVTDSAHIYAKDVSSSSEVFVRDEAGNVTQISPHNEAGEWQYWSQNVKTGKKVRINMERMIRKLEEITGETFIESE